MLTFDLQMFAEDQEEPNITIPGIDDDIAQAIAGEISDTNEEEAEETATADAHSDNKEDIAEYDGEDVEGNPIPYSRFKAVNDRMKAAEARVKELEAGQNSTSNQASAQQEEGIETSPASQAPIQQAQGVEFNVEQMKSITAEARKRAAAKMNLSDEDIENLEYTDDESLKDTYNALTAKYRDQVEGEVISYMRSKNNYNHMLTETRTEYPKLVSEFKALPNFEDVWAEVGRQANAKGQKFAQMLQDSINRLDQGNGTYQDLYVTENYIRGVIAGMKQSSTTKTTNSKIKNAANLPRATEVGGTAKGDVVYDITTITQMMNEGRWDELPEDVQRKVMRGTL